MADDNLHPASPQVPHHGAAPVTKDAVTATPPPLTANGSSAPAVTSRTPPPPPGAGRSLFHGIREAVWPTVEPQVQQTESVREVVETVVFVVVLVLLLKSFAAEAFVIPTGSMAETLLGYQKMVTCPECGYHFPVNCSSEAEPGAEGRGIAVVGATCPNCREHLHFIRPEDMDQKEGPRQEGDHDVWYLHDPGWSSGDRVLVAKSLYEFGLMHPERHDVVVFKFPGNSAPGAYDEFPLSGPQKNHVPMNYIKRLIGLGGETIGIRYGKLYVMHGGDEPSAADLEAPAVDRWKRPFMHEDKFKTQLEEHDPRFQIVRKRPDKILAVRRLVYDNDFQARDLREKQTPRWSGWNADGENKEFRATPGAASVSWLRYQHLLRETRDANGKPQPSLITDFLGYNTWETGRGGMHNGSPPQDWVGDLILECEVTVDQPTGTLVLELSRGVDRFRARWDLAAGTCTLTRVSNGKEQELAKEPTALKQHGTYRLRFANVDDRLVVWVNSSLPFGDGIAYEAPSDLGPRAENDLQPASVGAEGAIVTVRRLKLWRDIYYTLRPGEADASMLGDDWADPDRWGSLKNLPAKTLYVQPGHYLCMGDNSMESSDSRAWGLVPERLLLGRALMVYFPFGRAGPIR